MNTINIRTFDNLFQKGTESDIEGYSIKDAAIVLSTDTHKVFLDIGQETRLEISDIIKGYTSTQIEAVTPTVYYNKLYLASDTNDLYVYKVEDNVTVAKNICEVTEVEYASYAGSPAGNSTWDYGEIVDEEE